MEILSQPTNKVLQGFEKRHVKETEKNGILVIGLSNNKVAEDITVRNLSLKW